ncbi:MAG: prephenate dehydrogenase/arogenate dehydrogenase family protein [Acidobacteriota bacterium]|nr:prephenate dehydrogenase/arogenate dehydrogenase family protein [Acidobacteriota bacterium]
MNNVISDFQFRCVAIVGLGLLGGSLGLALKKAGFAGRIVGYARRAGTRDQALRAGAIDEAFTDVTEAVRGADLVILATPVAVILDQLPRLQPHLSPQALITDVGSTKRRICKLAAELYSEAPLFLGGHPMAGKERSGLENADARLFKNARYVLTPIKQEHLNDARVQAFRRLVTAIGARPLTTDPATHDLAVAYLSHLPQLLSSGLASLVEEKHTNEGLTLEVAASGFRDVTRLADSPYSIWRDICLTNTENIQMALDALIQKLESIKLHLSGRELENEFLAAHRLRDKLRGPAG